MTLSFVRQTFDQCNAWMLELNPVFWPTNIWLTQCLLSKLWPCPLVDGHLTDTMFGVTVVTLSFVRQTFGQHTVWLTKSWTCHMFDRHLTDTMLGCYNSTLSFGRQTFYCRNVCCHSCDPVIWLTDILLIQCLVYTTLTLSFCRQTFHLHNAWMTMFDITVNFMTNCFFVLSTKCLSAKRFFDQKTSNHF